MFLLSLLLIDACSTYVLPRSRTVSIEAETDMLTYQYIQQISNKIEIIGAARYPDLYKEIRVSSQIDIELVINSSGKLESARLLKSSKQTILDKKILDIVRYAAPYPPFPDDLKLDRLIIHKSWQFIPNN